MRKSLVFLIVVVILSACKFENNKHLESPIIPRPNTMFPVPSSYTISDKTMILLDSDDEKMIQLAERLKVVLDSNTQQNIPIKNIKEADGLKDVILLSSTNTSERIDQGGYHIEVDKDKVIVQGQDFGGVFNGVMTLTQMVLLHEIQHPDETLEFPNVQIYDEPHFQYRGMHLDVGRHFFPVSFIKKYLDIMALYKFNYFHWHLTEDQGWRIEIKAFPELTEVAAWRIEEDGSKYGGFYTQDDIREIVKYAQDLNITIIPEIEMPGHSAAALAAFPQLSCTGEKKEVRSDWGVFEDVYCAGNEETFQFLEKVMDEVMELFPGEYIHVGGDECPKARWEKCSKCQNRIKEEGLANEQELQSYFIRRMEKYLNAHGKKLIGWDEILEGGLAPDATVMSWRGIEGGIEAAKQEHQVIMTPTDYCYFDHYQADPEFEPKAIGGYLPLSKVYEFNPIPKELNEEQQNFILGGQANLWTEYIATEDYLEYMLLPRMLALSEALWSRERNKDFDDFNERLQTHQKLLEKLGYHYSKGSYRIGVKTEYDTASKENKLSFSSEQYKPEIRYVLQEGMLLDSGTIYEKPFSPEESGIITAGIFEDGKLVRKSTQINYVKHLGIGQDIKFLKKPSWRYGAETGAGLLDGIRGTDNFRDGKWSGFQGKDIMAEIDFKEATDVKQISFSYINEPGAWILPPKSVSIYTRVKDGNYQLILEQDLSDLLQKPNHKKGDIALAFEGNQIVAIKIVIENYKTLPANHDYAGEECWLFVDELVIE